MGNKNKKHKANKPERQSIMAEENIEKKEHMSAEAVQDIEQMIDEVIEADNDAEERIKELNNQLEEARAAVEKEKKEYLFLLADFDNFRKRVAKEKIELARNGAEKALKDLLPIVDDFERGLQATESVDDPQAIRSGMQLIYQKFVKYLADNGVKPIDSQTGSDFDTDRHEAIATIPAPTPDLKGKIVDTTQNGYLLNDSKVLRHAKVVVGE